MWQRIDHAPARHSGLWLALATAAAVALLLLGVSRWLAPQGSGRLALVSGGVPVVLGAEERSEAPRFEDGSQISLRKGSRLEVLRNDARSFVTALRRGDVTFDVQPGGKRHWVIEAGELSVEVVGTRFRVERQAESTRVSVEHGVVLVRGERVTGGAVRLTAGQSFTLQPLRAPTSPSAEPILTPPSAAAAFASSGPAVSAVPVDVVARELSAADEARRRADNASAVRHFEAAWASAAPGDTRRGLSALSLARLLMAGNPAKAAQILRSSLSDMPAALREDAQARWVEAESRAGDLAAAQRAADEYRLRFPTGQRLQEVERWSKP
jgi:transmembrane sensor